MAVMGLVMMPGMMTGQMLGGQPPVVAGCYQVMIMYLVSAAGCITTGLLLFFAAFSLTGVVILLRHRPHLTVERREE